MAEQTREPRTEPTAAPAAPQTVVLVNPALTPVTATEGLDVTTPGGAYRVGEQTVDANGQPLKGKDKD